MSLPPRLLNPAAARRYLSGADPADLAVRPCFVKGEPYYDRAVIDARLDAMAGIGPSSGGDDPESALQNWVQGRGAASGRP